MIGSGSARTVDEVLRWRAEHQPDRTAVTFLPDGELERAEDITHGELGRRARVVAGFLRERRQRGQAVILVHADGLEFVAATAACLRAGAMALPTYSPDRGPAKARARIESAVAQCGAAVALCSSAELGALRKLVDSSDALRGLEIAATDELDPSLGDVEIDEPPGPDDIALLLGTSGSTGSSRWVAVSHANALAQCAYLSLGFRYGEGSIHVGWPPVSNTGGFVFTVLNPLVTGFRSVRLPAVAFLGRPVSWLAAITHYRGTHGHGPNFAYDLCSDAIAVEEKARLDLSSWEHAINGAEPVRPETLERFSRAFASCGFRPGTFSLSYGLSESTMQLARSGSADGPRFFTVDAAHLQRTGQAIEAGPDAALVRRLPIYTGHGELHRRLVIVDPDTHVERPPGYEGEIWAAGDDLAHGGYLGDPEATAVTFGQRTADGQGPFLRTGDLGFVLGNELCVSGRLKDIIIIRGANHSPVEIEWCALRAHPAVTAGASVAFAVVEGGEERLVVVAELAEDAQASATEVARAIRAAVAREQMLHAWNVVLTGPVGIPRTPNGKVQRRACRTAYLAGALPIIHESATPSQTLYEPGVLVERGPGG